MRNDYKHEQRHVISLEHCCMTESGDYGPAFRTEDDLERYQEGVPIVEQSIDPALHKALTSLSPRRQMIAELKVQGYSGVEIAKQLHISPAAVTKHLQVIRETLEPCRK